MRWRIFALVAFLCLAACGDDDSDFATRPDGKESSSSAAPKSSDGKTKNDGSEYDADANTLTDFRDGQIYKTVSIGDQVWMAENLNYAYTDVPFEISGNTDDSTSWCYDNDPVNCSKYGRLYTWAAAMDSVGTWSANSKGCGYLKTCSPSNPVRGVCPKDWHLPSNDEWNTLVNAVGDSITAGKVLKSTSGWNNYNGKGGNGTDAFGFSAFSTGYRVASGSYSTEGDYANVWSSTEDDDEGAYNMHLYYHNDDVDLDNNPKYNGFSVRCVKD